MSFSPYSDRVMRARREENERHRLAQNGGPPNTPFLNSILGKPYSLPADADPMMHFAPEFRQHRGRFGPLIADMQMFRPQTIERMQQLAAEAAGGPPGGAPSFPWGSFAPPFQPFRNLSGARR